ncbi:hypothetical protein [Paenibacillus xylanilyticus]|uniref:hypothetical protein n=1 Tax=Paenibacillus xylanilyticus TaxID=248903 RepID=UPI0039A26311
MDRFTPSRRLIIDGTIQTGGSPGEEPVDILEYLFDRGADVHITVSKGSSPIDVAMSYKSKKIVQFLQEYRPVQPD